jgi:predicted ester cyclase
MIGAISGRRFAAAALAALWLLAAVPASAQSAAVLTPDAARRVIAPFYDMLNQPATKNLPALADASLAPGWRSYSSDTQSKGRDEVVAQFGGFGKLIPDLAWTIKDVLVSGDKVVVRGEATGTPQGPLFGVAASGKRFQIMSIDIHTVRDGRIVASYHVEDWASAMRQLSAQ